jgi:hypothetical protein
MMYCFVRTRQQQQRKQQQQQQFQQPRGPGGACMSLPSSDLHARLFIILAAFYFHSKNMTLTA